MPLRGHVDQITHYKVSGWAFDDSDPESAIQVVISVNDRPISTVVADRFRDDLKTLGEGFSGNSGFQYIFEPPLSIFNEIHVRVTFESTGRVLGEGERTLSALSNVNPRTLAGIATATLPTYVIHIGPPKVGSKYIQTSLAALSAELLKDGICYPTNLFSDRPQVWHRTLSERLAEGRTKELERVFDSLNSAGHKYICLSYEGFFGVDDEALANLGALTNGADIRIVYYCRKWSERIPSLWKQNVKEGFVETFPEYYCRSMNAVTNAPDLNPRLIWDRFASVFGRESIYLVSFNNLVDHKVDIVEHFLRTFLEWRYSAAPVGVLSNESPDLFDTEILRALNAMYLRQTGRTSDSVRVRFLREREGLDVSYLTSVMKKDVGSIVVNDRSQIFDIAYEQMESYRDRLVSPEFGERLFARTAKECSYVQQNYLIDSHALNELQRLFDEIDAAAPLR